MTTRRSFMATVAGLAAAPCMPAIGRAAPREVTVTFGPATPVYGLSFIASDKGFFAEEGLTFRHVPTDAGTRTRQNLAAGEAMFGHGDASHALQLTNRGKRAKIIVATQVVASFANHCIRQDLFESGIDTLEKFADWKRPNGAKPILGVTAIGAGTWMYSTALFQRRKLDRNINWVASGGTSTSLAGLKTKQFDVICTPPSWQVEVEKNGYGRAIYDVKTPGVWMRDFGGNVPVLNLYALEDTINEQPELVQSFVNAIVKAMAWVRANSVDQVYSGVAGRYSGLDPEAAKAELAFDPQTWPAYNGLLTREDFARGLEVWNRPGTDIPPMRFEDVVDMRFVEAALEKAG